MEAAFLNSVRELRGEDAAVAGRESIYYILIMGIAEKAKKVQYSGGRLDFCLLKVMGKYFFR